MIYNLRKKFITISAISIGIVFLLIFGTICVVSISLLNSRMDTLTDVIASNNGIFPDFEELERPLKPSKPMEFGRENFLTPETKFSTRFFTVWVDDNNQIIRENVVWI